MDFIVLFLFIICYNLHVLEDVSFMVRLKQMTNKEKSKINKNVMTRTYLPRGPRFNLNEDGNRLQLAEPFKQQDPRGLSLRGWGDGQAF